MKLTRFPLVFAALLCPATAQIVSYTDRPSWETAAGMSYTTIRFDEIPAGSNVGTFYQSVGADFPENESTLSATSSYPNDGAGLCGPCGGGGAIVVEFASPTRSVACAFPGAITFQVFSGATMIGVSQDFGGSGVGFFGGITSAIPFDSVVIYDWFDWNGTIPSTGTAYIDDLLFDGDGSVGPNYCTAAANSTGVSAEISALGSPVASNNDVTLQADSLPSHSFGVFLVSRTQGFIPMPGGSQGNLCVGGSVGRYVGPGQIQNSGAAGSISLVLDLAAVPQPTGFVAVAAGDTWNFQAWYRDGNPGPTSNFTDGVSVTFL